MRALPTRLFAQRCEANRVPEATLGPAIDTNRATLAIKAEGVAGTVLARWDQPSNGGWGVYVMIWPFARLPGPRPRAVQVEVNYHCTRDGVPMDADCHL